VIGIGDALDPYSYAHAPLALPAGDWLLVGDPDDARTRCNSAGAWAATASTATRKARARRRASSTQFDGETLDLLAACVRVRDLVNTPTEHMGPDELEAVARELAPDARGSDDRHRRRRFAGAELPGDPCGRPRLAPRAAPDRAALGRCVASARRDLSARACASTPAAWTSRPPPACAT
jgi:hypothetical protein